MAEMSPRVFLKSLILYRECREWANGANNKNRIREIRSFVIFAFQTSLGLMTHQDFKKALRCLHELIDASLPCKYNFPTPFHCGDFMRLNGATRKS
ncbi:MAG: hypothetical protein A3K45_06180 [Chloroflexi bacterium RIFOXYC12_FULL_59_14]|nr:MAG: hypothetical protein A3K45_06180 [Chloroflexi bacterium RIFOXYC12_FULL_59_14]OGO77052.1 MAG: hypothetical protein A3K41_11515 [Chloroflexi bacterium RIFOXYD12_FULL_57_15]